MISPGTASTSALGHDIASLTQSHPNGESGTASTSALGHNIASLTHSHADGESGKTPESVAAVSGGDKDGIQPCDDSGPNGNVLGTGEQAPENEREEEVSKVCDF